MRTARSIATLVCALGIAAGSAAAQNAPTSAQRGVDPLPPVTLAPGDSPEKMFTPARIAAILTIADINEIDPSRLALTNSQNPAIQAFARDMIVEHTTLEQSLRDMLTRKKMLEQDNALSLQLKRNAQPTLDDLRSKRGADFDNAYVLQQIESHDLVLKTLDTSLIPLASDPDLKTVLQNTVRPAVARHLARIKAIHDAMLATAAH